jgi:PhnB protein
MLLPSISFQGNCEEAINYYKDAFGAEVKVISYLDDAMADFGETPEDLGVEVKADSKFVTYSEVELFGTTFMLTDGAEHPMENQNFHFTISFDTEAELRTVFAKLADGGQVVEEPTEQFWAKLNAYVIDRFGIFWNIMFGVEK